MNKIINALPLYNFIKYCEASDLERNVIDCGAGGSFPPLALFHSFGYEVFGIDNSVEQIEAANVYEDEHGIDLNIELADMTNIPRADASHSFLYSYNTSVHMPKSEFVRAISEFKRVVKPGGLIFINFLSYDCDTYGVGIKISEGVYVSYSDDTQFIHYTNDELNDLLSGFEIVYHEKKTISRKMDNEVIKSGFYDYILKKI